MKKFGDTGCRHDAVHDAQGCTARWLEDGEEVRCGCRARRLHQSGVRWAFHYHYGKYRQIAHQFPTVTRGGIVLAAALKAVGR